jgi:hypothetical protein
MEKSIQQIYCDESGTTGNKLMDPNQPLFSYASIAISHEEAKACVEKARRDYRVQASELKFGKLVSYNRGRQAITQILAQHHKHLLASVYHKKYALAGKLFEYTFEPALADHNSLFYSIGFHRFVANMLFVYFQARAQFAEEIFQDFENLMRALNDEPAKYLFGAVHLPETPVLDLIRRFCAHNRRAIQEELDSLRGHGVGKWVLDLTASALFQHLAFWGTRYYQLDVYCDETKTLEGFWDLMKVMIGREEKIYNKFLDREQPITFNLHKQVSTVKSSDNPGVQLADVAAGAAVYALQNPADPLAIEWLELLFSEKPNLSIMPDFGQIDVKDISAKRNLMLLQELVDRSERGLSLTEGIDDFLVRATRLLAQESSGLFLP